MGLLPPLLLLRGSDWLKRANRACLCTRAASSSSLMEARYFTRSATHFWECLSHVE